MTFRTNQVTIDYGAIAENAAVIMERAHKQIFAVVKNNAYNFGLGKVVSALMGSGVKDFAVNVWEEAAEIKALRPDANVLQLNPASEAEIKEARENGIALSVTSLEWLEAHKDNLQGIDLHLKINVGMNRFGLRNAGEARRALSVCEEKKLSAVGLHTHFPLAEEDDVAGHDRQVDEFAEIHRTLSASSDFQYVHAENTATLLRQDPRLEFCNYARLGILLYGYVTPPMELQDWLRPALFAHSRVVDVHTVGSGEHLGYGTSFEAPGNMKIAVLPIGYGDGLLRARKGMPVYIDGRPYPIAGGISMSHTYIEADDAVKVGDVVEIYGEHARPDRLAAVGLASNSEQTTALHTGA